MPYYRDVGRVHKFLQRHSTKPPRSLKINPWYIDAYIGVEYADFWYTEWQESRCPLQIVPLY